MSPAPSPRILVIRRDNIGDLVCTTPLLRALRERFPDAWLGALVNSYNAPVLAGNPDLDEVAVYTKAKHRGAGETLPGVLWARARMLLRLRAARLDDIIIATPSAQPRTVRLARWLGPRRVIGFGNLSGLDLALPPAGTPMTEAEDVFRIAAAYGIAGPPPPCRVVAPADASGPGRLTVAIHVSARKPSQRWPAERFVALMRELRSEHDADFVLLWAPGAADNPLHPGDDEKAAQIVAALGPGFPVRAAPTSTLTELIRALAGCRFMVCGDGGAMHLACGLGLPIVCLFGRSDATRWRPWGVPYRLLQMPSENVADIPVEAVARAFRSLAGETAAAGGAAR